MRYVHLCFEYQIGFLINLNISYLELFHRWMWSERCVCRVHEVWNWQRIFVHQGHELTMWRGHHSPISPNFQIQHGIRQLKIKIKQFFFSILIWDLWMLRVPTFKFNWSSYSTIGNILNTNCSSTWYIFVNGSEACCGSITIITVRFCWIFMSLFLECCVLLLCVWILFRWKRSSWPINILRNYIKCSCVLACFILNKNYLRINLITVGMVIGASTFRWSFFNQFEFIVSCIVFGFTVQTAWTDVR